MVCISDDIDFRYKERQSSGFFLKLRDLLIQLKEEKITPEQYQTEKQKLL